ncbi:MAG: hypothetical protein D6755_03655 [Anaerolineae bacterium]|nr:MAG: hypothetical protein D6755_03655 [Anaerolineae bacterium]
MSLSSPPSPLHCVNHPETETYLRCNRCERPICPSCATSTPTGYRCPDCVRAQQKTFETALPRDYFIGFVLAALLSGVGNYIAMQVGFWGLLLAFVTGYIIAEAVRKATGRRRSEKFFRTVAAGTLLGTLPFAFIMLLSLIGAFIMAGQSLTDAMPLFFFPLLQAAYMAIVTSAAYRRLKGIVL